MTERFLTAVLFMTAGFLVAHHDWLIAIGLTMCGVALAFHQQSQFWTRLDRMQDQLDAYRNRTIRLDGIEAQPDENVLHLSGFRLRDQGGTQ